jgi:hypothetical protein
MVIPVQLNKKMFEIKKERRPGSHEEFIQIGMISFVPPLGYDREYLTEI